MVTRAGSVRIIRLDGKGDLCRLVKMVGISDNDIKCTIFIGGHSYNVFEAREGQLQVLNW